MGLLVVALWRCAVVVAVVLVRILWAIHLRGKRLANFQGHSRLRTFHFTLIIMVHDTRTYDENKVKRHKWIEERKKKQAMGVERVVHPSVLMHVTPSPPPV